MSLESRALDPSSDEPRRTQPLSTPSPPSETPTLSRPRCEREITNPVMATLSDPCTVLTRRGGVSQLDQTSTHA